MTHTSPTHANDIIKQLKHMQLKHISSQAQSAASVFREQYIRQARFRSEVGQEVKRRLTRAISNVQHWDIEVHVPNASSEHEIEIQIETFRPNGIALNYQRFSVNVVSLSTFYDAIESAWIAFAAGKRQPADTMTLLGFEPQMNVETDISFIRTQTDPVQYKHYLELNDHAEHQSEPVRK